MDIDKHYKAKALDLSGKAIKNIWGTLTVQFTTSFEDSPIPSTFITLCPCPQGWEKTYSDGHPYFFNATTKQVTSVLPPQRDFDVNGLRLPHGWIRESGYYRNFINGVIQQVTPMYQGDSVATTNVDAKKPVASDFQFFETSLEKYNEFGRRDNDSDVEAWSVYAGAPGAAFGAFGATGALCIIQ